MKYELCELYTVLTGSDCTLKLSIKLIENNSSQMFTRYYMNSDQLYIH